MKGQVAVVTGGAQGIGLVVAHLLAEQGAGVTSWYIDPGNGAAISGLGEGTLAIECDIIDLASVEAAYARTCHLLGTPSILVNSAGIAGPNASAYSASKAAVIGLTKSLGKELAGYDIAVNCVTPTAARTRIFDQMSEKHIDYMLSKIPRGRFMDVAEVAKLIVWTVSPENSFTTWAVFDLSGGRSTY